MLSLIEESYHSCRAPLREQRRGGVDLPQRYKRQPSSLVRHRPGASEGGGRGRRVLKERCTTFGNRERTKVRGRRGGCGKGGGEEETVRNGELGARSARQRVSALPHLWTGTYAHSRERRGGVKTEKQGVVVRQVEREQKRVKTPPSPLPSDALFCHVFRNEKQRHLVPSYLSAKRNTPTRARDASALLVATYKTTHAFRLSLTHN